MTYNYPATQNNGRIASSVDGVAGQTVSYTYDALNRLVGASASPAWAEEYTYDGFGNLTSKTPTVGTAPAMNASYDVNNHQVGLTYDANGNQSWDAQHATAYTWNVENKLITETSQAWPGPASFYGYDPWGRRVMQDVNPDPTGQESAGYTGGTWMFYLYDIYGRRIFSTGVTYYPDGTPTTEWGPTDIYFGKKLITVNWNCVVTDRLGSVRGTATGDGSCGGWTPMSYFPYGEEQTSTADGTEKFATYLRDAAGQDYAIERYYNFNTGRFWSVDPGGIRTANPVESDQLESIHIRERRSGEQSGSQGPGSGGAARVRRPAVVRSGPGPRPRTRPRRRRLGCDLRIPVAVSGGIRARPQTAMAVAPIPTARTCKPLEWPSTVCRARQ
jgi:YD repeat-containing protein